MATAEAPQLKQLEVVRTTSVKAVETATSLANTAAGYAPSTVVTAATAVYDRVAPSVMPYAEKTMEIVKPKAEAALVAVDDRVDNVVTAAKTFYSKSYDTASTRYAQLQGVLTDGKGRFEAYAAEYFKLIDESLKTVKGKLKEAASTDAVALVSTKMAELKTMLGNMNEMSKEHIMHHFAQLQTAWEALLARPEVSNLLEYSDSSVKSLVVRAEAIHDTIVADPRYSSLLDTAGSWINWAQATTVGSKITTIASPYADAVYKTKYVEAAAPYATRVMEYWKPAPPLEGIKTK